MKKAKKEMSSKHMKEYAHMSAKQLKEHMGEEKILMKSKKKSAMKK